MKRRIIVVATLVLYAVLLGVTWEVGTRQAAQETEAQLDNAILEFRSTVGGAIDTMLDHAAKTAVRKLGGVRSSSIEEMSALARDLDIDEVNVVSRAGEIVASAAKDEFVRQQGGGTLEDIMLRIEKGGAAQ